MNNVTDELFENQLVNDPRQRASNLPLSGQTQSQLMEGQYMEVEERQPVFDGEQRANTIGERLGRNEDPDRDKRISGLRACEMIDKSGFERRMESTGDEAEHLPRIS